MLRFLYSNKWIVGLLVGLGAIILGGGYISSLWFLRGVWEASAEIEFGYQHTELVKHFFSHEGKLVEAMIRERVGLAQDGIYRMTYSKSSSGEYVSIIPRLRSQFQTATALRASGWEPVRVGWTIFAVRGGKVRPSVWRGIKEEAKMALLHQLPVSPVFFFRSAQQESPLLAVHASKERGGVRGVISIDSQEFTPLSPATFNERYSYQKELIVSLPSNVFRSINNDFLITLEKALAQKFQFEKTTPSPISWIPEGEQLYLIANSEHVAIGVLQNGAIVGTRVLASMEKEQGHRHPRRKAFPLPDRSIGYEYVPGAANLRFMPGQGAADCLPSEGYDETLFLCGKKDGAIVASSEDMGKRLLGFMDSMQGRWGGYIPGEYPIYFQGSNKSIDILIQDIDK